jgi:hypothetical protein
MRLKYDASCPFTEKLKGYGATMNSKPQDEPEE